MKGTESTPTTTFVEALSEDCVTIDNNLDPTFDLKGYDKAQLDTFLKRPLSIFSGTWTPGAGFFQEIDPWTLYMTEPSVKDKLRHFLNFKGELHVKVMLNANQFYYGALQIGYNPYPFQDDVTNFQDREIDMMELSQRPGMMLDVTSSHGGEMILPWIYPTNYSYLSTASFASDIGKLQMRSYSPLRHANGGLDAITVTILAWMENIDLVVPTTFHLNAPRVTGKTWPSRDEIEKGAISSVASSIQAVGRTASSIPLIGKYARATAEVARAVGAAAKMFGYSRPTDLKDETVVVPRYVSNMVNTDRSDPVVKLAVDSRNELSIDPTLCGAGDKDELAIANFTDRYGYYFQGDWPSSSSPGALVGTMSVGPLQCRHLGAERHFNPLTYAACAFDTWRGTITVKIVVIAPGVSKGRLRIVYDAEAIADDEMNQTFNYILDISEQREVEIEIDWAQYQAWAPTLQPFPTTGETFYSTTTPLGYNGRANGVLGVYVMNKLTSPSNLAVDATVLFFVKGGPDTQFACPTHTGLLNLSPFQQQALKIGSSETDDALVYQGEKVVSFRNLLKRYQYHGYFPIASYLADGFRYYAIPNYPEHYGFDSAGRDQTSLGQGFNYVGNVLLNYLMLCFVGARGTIRHKLVAQNRTNILNFVQVQTFGIAEGSCPAAPGLYDFAASGSAAQDAQNRRGLIPLSGNNGLCATNARYTGSLDYEVPFYSYGQRFRPARQARRFGITDTYFHRLIMSDTGTGANANDGFLHYVAAGEDFNLTSFVSTPVLFAYEPPTAI